MTDVSGTYPFCSGEDFPFPFANIFTCDGKLALVIMWRVWVEECHPAPICHILLLLENFRYSLNSRIPILSRYLRFY